MPSRVIPQDVAGTRTLPISARAPARRSTASASSRPRIRSTRSQAASGLVGGRSREVGCPAHRAWEADDVDDADRRVCRGCDFNACGAVRLELAEGRPAREAALAVTRPGREAAARSAAEGDAALRDIAATIANQITFPTIYFWRDTPRN